MDGFHRPRAERYRRGRTSPTGYWLDAFDHGRLAAVLLEPFGRGEPVRTAVHDVRTDARVDLGPIPVPEDAVLIVDGVFTHRDELAAYWEFSVYLQVDMEIAVARMIARDGIPPTTVARYVAADRIYAALRPAERATVVLDNTDVAAPRLRIPAG
jgi:uridine kinase